jgi:hypothetical protein
MTATGRLIGLLVCAGMSAPVGAQQAAPGAGHQSDAVILVK